MWNIVNTVLGLDYLTPQGIRFGVAASLALSVLVPARSTTDVIVVNGIIAVVAGLLVAQAVSLGAHW